jgi:hypothetical protein
MVIFQTNKFEKMRPIFICLALLLSVTSFAHDTVKYMGKTLVIVDYTHGQLSPVVGVHNIQVLRANRENPQFSEGTG